MALFRFTITRQECLDEAFRYELLEWESRESRCTIDAHYYAGMAKKYRDRAAEIDLANSSSSKDTDFFALIDAAHKALRMVDASDTSKKQTDETLNLVSETISKIETVMLEHGLKLSEFR